MTNHKLYDLFNLLMSILKDIDYKFEPHLCNECHDILMMAYEKKKHCNTKCKRC